MTALETLLDEGKEAYASGDYQTARLKLNDLLKQSPDDFEALAFLARVDDAVGDLTAAVKGYEKALAIKPEHETVHVLLAQSLLAAGDFERGFKEYQWRLIKPDGTSVLPDFRIPQWQGEDIKGKTIFLIADQGFGDSIQFVRYVPVLAKMGAAVIIAVGPELGRLFKTVTGITRFSTGPNDPHNLTADYFTVLSSLPYLMKTTLETVPMTVPYVHANPKQVKRWQRRLDKITGIKVGLIWAGRKDHPGDHSRSLTRDDLKPLSRSKARFVALQKGGDKDTIKRVCDACKIVDVTPLIQDFADTAAVMENLDLIISVDTAAAHLAGALGKPVWLLLPRVPEWRWMRGMIDSPWYPTFRLFSQSDHGGWAPVINAITQELDGYSAGSGW